MKFYYFIQKHVYLFEETSYLFTDLPKIQLCVYDVPTNRGFIILNDITQVPTRYTLHGYTHVVG